MIFDIISIIFLLVFAVIGAKTGAAKAFARFFSFILAFTAAAFLAHFIAQVIYSAFIKTAIISNINSVINDAGLTTASQKAAELFSGFPVVFANILTYFGISQLSLTSMLDAGAVNSIEGLFMTPVVAVISIILFIILSGILLFVVRKLMFLVAKLFRLPVIRIVDSVLGLFVGLLEGMLLVFVFAMAIKLAIPFTSGNLLVLNEEYISESYFFSIIYFGNFSDIVQNFVFSFNN